LSIIATKMRLSTSATSRLADFFLIGVADLFKGDLLSGLRGFT